MPFNRKLIPSTNSLLMFEAAARLGSFIKASEELCVSTAAVSKQIKSLENTLQISLFTRSKQGVDLTPDGRRYLDTVLQALNLLEKEAQSFVRNPVTILNVEVGLCFLHFWLLPRLDDFRQAYPDIQLNLIVNNERMDSRCTPGNSYDVAFYYGPVSQRSAGNHLLFPDRVLLVASPFFLSERIESSDLSCVLQQPKIMLREELPYWEGWQSISQRLGVTEDALSDNILYVEDQVAVIQAAVNNGGIALVNDWHVNELIDSGQLVPLSPEVAYPDKGYFLTAADEGGGPAHHFIDWAREQAEKDRCAA